MSHRLIYITFPNMDAAREVGRHIVAEGLASCVNILPKMHSVFVWDGKLEEADEVILLIKAAKSRQAAIVSLVKKEHPYKMPAILVFKWKSVDKAMAAWIENPRKPIGKDRPKA